MTMRQKEKETRGQGDKRICRQDDDEARYRRQDDKETRGGDKMTRRQDDKETRGGDKMTRRQEEETR